MQQPPLTTPDKKKRRLSAMFGKKHNSDLAPPTMLDHSLSHQGSSSTNGGIAADSAYASSDGPSSKRNSRAEIQPIENNGRIEGVAGDRSLDVNNRTGEVFDHETGEVVSTVTTTTTTTTTTVHKGPVGGRKGTTVQVETHKHQEQDQTDRAEIAEAPGDRPRREESIRIAQSQQQAALPTSTWHDDPPARNPNRKSRELAESPYKHNFSYPSRTMLNEENPVSPITSQPLQQGAGSSTSPLGHGSSSPFGHSATSSSSKPRSTLENLKTAAIGLHGVGETLRGTLNSEVDNRFPRHNASKAAAADAKNRSTLQRGNAELARLSGRSEWDRNREDQNGAPQIPALYDQNRAPSRSPRPLQSDPAQAFYPPPPSGRPPALATYIPSNPLSPGMGNTTTVGSGASFQHSGPGLQPHEGQHPAFRQNSYEQGDEIAHVHQASMSGGTGVMPVQGKKESGFRKLIKRRAPGS